MKLNKYLISMLIIALLSCSITAVFAQEVSLSDDTTISIPDGYKIKNQTDNLIILASEDGNKAITITNQDARTPEEAKDILVDQGFNFESEQEININDVNVTEQSFTKDQFKMYGYLFNIDDNTYIISAVTTEDGWNINDNDNPVRNIVDQLKK